MCFSELRMKEVINICDGRRLGRPIDVVFTDGACIEAIVVPGQYSVRNMIKGLREGIVIPWNRIRRVGDDVILVELDASFF
ncbi:MAG: YlmC/YmxH family sporulation protein [Clostridia bacterium]|nr:YlmC/YmxH family sporulation protein [Clostridia bacterium]